MRAVASDPSSQKRGVGIPQVGNFDLVRITRSVERLRSSADLELRLSCAAERQSILNQPLGAICAEIPGLARRLRGPWEPRDRAADVRMRMCGNRRRIFHENRHSARYDPIRLSKLPPLGAAATPGQPTEQPHHPAELSGHGAGAAE